MTCGREGEGGKLMRNSKTNFGSITSVHGTHDYKKSRAEYGNIVEYEIWCVRESLHSRDVEVVIRREAIQFGSEKNVLMNLKESSLIPKQKWQQN